MAERHAFTALAVAAAVLVGCGVPIGGTADDDGDDDGDDDAAVDRADARSSGPFDARFPLPDSGPADAAIPPPTGCKRGVSLTREAAGDAPAISQGISWWYNWSSYPEPAAYQAMRNAGVEYVPMIWTGPPRAGIDVDALIRDIPDDARYLLGFNEPNFGVQANLTPAQAAAAWPDLEAIAEARGLELVAPAVNYCGGDCNETDPFAWLDAFFAACQGCRIDHIALHWYACTPEALDVILDRFARYAKPLWLTEFSCLDDADISVPVQQRYMRQALPILENDPRVFRYAWFIGRSFPDVHPYALLDNPGQHTDLGDIYASSAGACE